MLKQSSKHPTKTSQHNQLIKKKHFKSTHTKLKRRQGLHKISKRSFFGETQPYPDEPAPHAPSTNKLNRATVKLTQDIKMYLESREASDVVDFITSDAFLELKEMIKVADSQATRSQAAEVVISISVVTKWLKIRLFEEPENIYYQTILNSIPQSFPTIGGSIENDDDDSDPDGFFSRLTRQARLAEQRESGAEWILRRNFWKIEGLGNTAALPIEWAEFLGSIANRIPMQNPDSLATIATYLKFCGMPFELYNRFTNEVVSRRANDPDTEIVSDIVEHIIATSPILLEALEAANHPDSPASILNSTWFQGLMSMATLVPAFESRLNEFQQKKVGTAHIPFAAILKKHHNDDGTPITRASPYLNSEVAETTSRKFFQAPIQIDIGDEADEDPFSPQRQYMRFLGGRNLSALSTRLQIDDIYMLSALCGDILHRFNGVESKLAIDDGINLNELFQHGVRKAGNSNEFKNFLVHSVEKEKLQSEDKMARSKRIKESQDAFFQKQADKIGQIEDDLDDKDVDNAHIQEEKQNTKSNDSTESLSDDDLSSDGEDRNHLIGQTLFVPEIAPYFVNPIDESRSFIAHFDSEDINEFLQDPIILRALTSIKQNHIKDVLNYRYLRSHNWMHLDLHEVNRSDTIDMVERFGPIDAKLTSLEDLENVYSHMLQQSNDVLQESV